jgi:hypothetical protein
MFEVATLEPMDLGSHFRAFSLRGNEDGRPIDPIMGVDHAWVSAPTFPPHPHAGFSAVSYLFLDSETAIDNRDSLGHQNLIRPGGLHWTAAGGGVIHEEFPVERGRTVHMLQIFVNLPRERQRAEPFALSLEPEDVPVVRASGATIRVPLGVYGDARSPLNTPTDVTLLDISLNVGAALTFAVAPGHGAFVLPIDGVCSIDGHRFRREDLDAPVLAVSASSQTLSLAAQDGAAKAVLFMGPPLRQPVHWQGSMAFASTDDLYWAMAAYQRGELGRMESGAASAA